MVQLDPNRAQLNEDKFEKQSSKQDDEATRSTS